MTQRCIITIIEIADGTVGATLGWSQDKATEREVIMAKTIDKMFEAIFSEVLKQAGAGLVSSGADLKAAIAAGMAEYVRSGDRGVAG